MAVPSALLTHGDELDLDGISRAVAIALILHYRRRAEYVWPSIERLSQLTGFSSRQLEGDSTILPIGGGIGLGSPPLARGVSGNGNR